MNSLIYLFTHQGEREDLGQLELLTHATTILNQEIIQHANNPCTKNIFHSMSGAIADTLAGKRNEDPMSHTSF